VPSSVLKKLLDKKINNKTLIYFSGLLNGIEYFPFYGTLLGLVRSGETLDKDDDVDICVNNDQYSYVVQLLLSNQLKITVQREKIFLQVERAIDGEIALCDFYFYEESDKLLIDKWSFTGFPDNHNNHLHIDSDLIFPLETINVDGHKINFPAKSIDVCMFLYGKNYKSPMEKSLYDISIINNRPMIHYKKENSRSLLLYNLYPINNWKEITKTILGNIPHHKSIIVNVTLSRFDKIVIRHHLIKRYLLRIPKVDKVIFSINDPQVGEPVGFNNLRSNINYDHWDIITYTHSKGVSRPNRENINDWVAMMKYFLVDRHDLCVEAFKDGYHLYGAQLREYHHNKERANTHLYSDYHYSGNFVSVNMRMLKKEFKTTVCPNNYYGVEAFFGLLCSLDKAYCIHSTPLSLYLNPYKKENYIN